MACAANYAMTDPRKRSDLGMMGAQALVSIHTEGAQLSAAALDEANAFSYLRTPQWLWPWMAAPPVLAVEVWAVLPAALRDTISKSTWVAPQYCRLPMGFAHSVHILMCVNLRHVGIVLFSSSKLYVNRVLRESRDWLYLQLASSEACDSSELEYVTDHLDWCGVHSAKLHQTDQQDSLDPDIFASRVRTAKLLDTRLIVICLAFAGPRRAGDIHDWLEGFALSTHSRILVFSFDLEIDSRWDFGDIRIFHLLLI